ncbi:MAG: hypothetical protein HYU66_18445, partial [Armatimonadetes bacterium]|nr:hypothetical protein [Armatimonadota bacterium]
MREPSFRRRVALLSAGLSGLVLLIVCGSGWALIARFGIRGVDHELVSRIQPEFRNEWPPEHWPQVQLALAYIYADRDATPPLLLVRRPDGFMVYCSPGWPRQLELRGGGPPPRPPAGAPPL